MASASPIYRERAEERTGHLVPYPATMSDVRGDNKATQILTNKLVKWVVKVQNKPVAVLSHVAEHPQDVPKDQWMVMDVDGLKGRQLMIDHRTARLMHGHRISFVVSAQRALGPVVHAVELNRDDRNSNGNGNGNSNSDAEPEPEPEPGVDVD